MDIYKKLFGDRLRVARKLMIPKMTQARFAELVGVEPPSVSRWETGVDFPENERLPLICKILGVPEAYFGENTEALSPPHFDLRPDEIAALGAGFVVSSRGRQLLALYILTKVDAYRKQAAAIPDAAPIALMLKKSLLP